MLFYTDKSHSKCIEVKETYPAWLVPWIQSLVTYTRQNESHLRLIEAWRREAEMRTNRTTKSRLVHINGKYALLG